MSTTNDRAPVVDIEITGEAIQALAGVLTRYGNRGWTETEASHVLGLLVDNGWAMTPLGLDVRDRIIDRLLAERAEMVEHWARMKEPASPASAVPFVALDRMLGDPPEAGLGRELAPDEASYFEARRANDG